MRNGCDDAGGGLSRVPGVWEAHGTLCAVEVNLRLALDKCQSSPPTLTPSLQVSPQP